jgi:hypothetical protein
VSAMPVVSAGALTLDLEARNAFASTLTEG